MAHYSSPADQSAPLDAPPPRPPDASRRAQPNLLTTGAAPGSTSPEALAIGGLAMIEQGFQILSTIIPGISALAGNVTMMLRQAVPQALSGGAPPMMGGPPAPQAPAQMGAPPQPIM